MLVVSSSLKGDILWGKSSLFSVLVANIRTSGDANDKTHNLTLFGAFQVWKCESVLDLEG